MSKEDEAEVRADWRAVPCLICRSVRFACAGGANAVMCALFHDNEFRRATVWMRVGFAGASPTHGCNAVTVLPRYSTAIVSPAATRSKMCEARVRRSVSRTGMSMWFTLCAADRRATWPPPTPDFERLTGSGAFDVISQVAP